MQSKNKPKLVFIGAGNLATNLAPALASAGFEITQVYSRTTASASKLAAKLVCSFTNKLENISKDADIYVISIKDDAIKKLASALRLPGKLVIHTSGSTSLKAIEKISESTGVLYPLQSFTKTKQVSFQKVPIFIEGSNRKSKSIISKIAGAISNSVIPASSEERLKLHIAAVYACNFTNHLYVIAEDLLKGTGVKFSYLYPLMLETTKRTEKNSPSKLQTGPAARNDKKTIKKHLGILKERGDDETTSIYRLLTKSIQKRQKKK